MRQLLSRHRYLAAGVVVAMAAAAGVALAASGLVLSQEGTSVVDFKEVTPFVVAGLPDKTPDYPPDLSKQPTCQAKSDEKPQPDVPPLSCRNSASEPPDDAINTPASAEIPNKTAVAERIPAGWTALDNRLLRFTVAIPPGWYSNMRPEGGEFTLYDPVASQEDGTGTNLPGGVRISFSARPALTPETGNLDLFPEEKLAKPNADFGGIPGVIWEEGPGEDLAKVIHAAFIQEGVLFEVYAPVSADFASPASIDAASGDVISIIETLRPY